MMMGRGSCFLFDKDSDYCKACCVKRSELMFFTLLDVVMNGLKFLNYLINS